MKMYFKKKIIGMVVALLICSMLSGFVTGNSLHAQVEQGIQQKSVAPSAITTNLGATITFEGHTYDSGTDTSNWTYHVTSGTHPSLSHWILELDLCIEESDIVAASEAYEFCEDDPHHHLRGIKFDTGYEDGESRDVWFKLQGDYAEGTVQYGYKEGTNAETGTITGPICSDDAGIDIEKKVWNETSGQWEDSIVAPTGCTLQFKLIVENTGSLELTSLTVDDALPNYLTYVSDSASPEPDSATDHHVEWTFATLGVGATKTFTFSAEATTTGNDYNSADVLGYYSTGKNSVVQHLLHFLSQLFDSLNLNLRPLYQLLDAGTVSDCDAISINIIESSTPGVSIVKQVWDGSSWVDSVTVDVGDDVEFRLTVTNTGNVDLSDVVVTDTLPGFLSSGSDLEWDLGTLTVGSSEEVTFSATADAVGDGDNSASVEGTYCSDTVSDSDTAYVVVEEAPAPGVSIVKQVWDGSSWVDSVTVDVGDDVEFRLTVTNTGTVDLDSYVHVDDDLPSFLIYNNDASPSPTSASSDHIEWHDLAPLAEGNSVTITFSAHADCAGEGDNAAAVEAQYDCTTPVTDSDSAHVLVEECVNPAVEIVKKVKDGSNWVDSVTVNVGDDVEFKLTVTNTGNVPLDTYVHVTDDLPGFLTYNYDGSNSPDVEQDQHIEWNNLAPLAVGDSVTLTFSAKADAVGEGDNSASVEGKYDCKPPVSDSDTAHVIVTCDGDDTPPETTKEYGSPFYTNGTSDWITSDTLIWLNATDYPLSNPSGVKNTYYRILKWDGSTWVVEIDWTIYSCPFTIPSECHHKIEFYSVDNACNQEETKWQTVYVDNTPPCTTYKITDDPDHYVCSVSTLTIEATDGGKCPVGSYWLYCYVDGDLYEKTHNKKISFQFNELYGFTEDKRYEVEFWAEDELGNEGNHRTEGFILDTTPPDTEYSFDGPNRWVDHHWQIEPTTKIVLTATDSSSGVKYTKYRQGYQDEGGTWETYSGPFIPTKENIFYYSKDNCRNQENLVHLYVEVVDSVENKPPQTPSKPSGQTYGHTWMSYTYTASTTDPEDDEIKYYFSWGDGTGDWTTLTTDEGSASHIWSQAKAGTHKVKVKAQDENGAESNWSPVLEVYISNQDNEAPEKPDAPSGPTSGRVNTEYTYTAFTSDPEGDNIMYVFDWGDGTDSGWRGPYGSGETVTATHTWTKKGNYEVRVKARDVFGEETAWSDPLPLSMPKNINHDMAKKSQTSSITVISTQKSKNINPINKNTVDDTVPSLVRLKKDPSSFISYLLELLQKS